MLRWVDVNLNRGRATVIASRPGVGKTAFALRLARQVLEHTSAGVAYFSLQASRRQLVTRLACARSGLPIQGALHRRTPASSQDGLAEDARAWAESRPLHVLDTIDVTVEQILERLEALHTENGVRVAFIDYVQLVRRRSDDMAQEEATAHTVGASLRPGQLVVLESTTYPGTTEARALGSALERLPLDVFVLCQVRPRHGGRLRLVDVPLSHADPRHVPTWRTVVLHRDRDESGGLVPELHVDLFERGETEPSYSESGQLDRQSGRICLGTLLS